MTAGIVVDGAEVRIDIDAVRKGHEVNEGDPNCRECSVEYPCELLELVEWLDMWLRTHPQAPVPDGAGEREDHTC